MTNNEDKGRVLQFDHSISRKIRVKRRTTSIAEACLWVSISLNFILIAALTLKHV